MKEPIKRQNNATTPNKQKKEGNNHEE